VATALWRERAPDLLTLVAANSQPSAALATDPDPDPEPGSAQSRGPEAQLTALEFTAGENQTRLTAALDAPLAGPPGYRRAAGHVELRLPVPAPALSVPAPPADQQVFKAVSVARRGETTVLRIAVAPRARFDLAPNGRELTLTGRLPAARTASAATQPTTPEAGNAPTPAEPAPGADDTAAATTASAESATRDSAAEAAPQTPDAGDGAAPGEPTAGAATGAERESATAAAGEEAPPASADSTDQPVRKSEPEVPPAERARRLEGKARTAVDAGNLATARARLSRALAADPGRHSARELQVTLALRRGEPETARNLLAEGVARAPQRAGFARPYARLLVDAGAVERAWRVLRRAQPGDGGASAGYYGLMAAVAQRLERHQAAVQAYSRALERDAGRGLWWLGLGISLAKTGHADKARSAFEKARASGDLNERLDAWAASRLEALSG
jgi:Tfp pilus assembly protein PilF